MQYGIGHFFLYENVEIDNVLFLFGVDNIADIQTLVL